MSIYDVVYILLVKRSNTMRFFYNLFIGAAGESRTHNQLTTGQLRCHLRHDSKLEQAEALNLIRICKRAID